MQPPRFEITRIPETESAAKAFLTLLDLQIDELQANLHLLQTVRRATAACFGVDRRTEEESGKIAAAADAAKRAEYEGGDERQRGDGRLKVANG